MSSGCEARLAAEIDVLLDAGWLPERALLSDRFVVDPPQLDLLLQAAAPADHAGAVEKLHRPRRPRRGGPPPACSPRSPATRSPTASAGASSGTGPRRSCRRARRWRPLTSPSSRRCRRRECACWRAAMSGSGNGRTCSCSARPERAKSHLASGLGLALVENGFRVLYQRTGTGAGTSVLFEFAVSVRRQHRLSLRCLTGSTARAPPGEPLSPKYRRLPTRSRSRARSPSRPGRRDAR